MNNIHTISFIPFFNLDMNIAPNSMDSFQQIIFAILVLSIILLWSFINVIGYFGVLYGIKYIDIENKYAKYKNIIDYFKKLNYFFIILETILILTILLSVIGICSYLLYFSLT